VSLPSIFRGTMSVAFDGVELALGRLEVRGDLGVQLALPSPGPARLVEPLHDPALAPDRRRRARCPTLVSSR